MINDLLAQNEGKTEVNSEAIDFRAASVLSSRIPIKQIKQHIVVQAARLWKVSDRTARTR